MCFSTATVQRQGHEAHICHINQNFWVNFPTFDWTSHQARLSSTTLPNLCGFVVQANDFCTHSYACLINEGDHMNEFRHTHTHRHVHMLCFQIVPSYVHTVRTEATRALLTKPENNRPMLHIPWSTVAGQKGPSTLPWQRSAETAALSRPGKIQLVHTNTGDRADFFFVNKCISFLYLQLIKCMVVKMWLTRF